ncbi:dethiobiotin synthase, partial [Streptomyces sp. FT05W]
MTILVVTGTGTEIGKTIVTAAVAAAYRDLRVAVLKPAQTGLAPHPWRLGQPHGVLTEVPPP